MNYKPAIVVVAFDRIHSLIRLLSSLLKAQFPIDVPLIISIDNKEPYNSHILNYASEFKWPFGEKKVIYQENRLGLKKHIISCGNMSKVYGSVIILEDDLYVSPYFYTYTLEALNYYQNDKNVGGISLYNYTRTETKKKPFVPLKDNSDVYFLQISSSLGQAWTSEHWQEFINWYDKNPDLNKIRNMPRIIKLWPDTSWKKYFIGFLIKHDKYFVFPQLALTTNFNDAGTNIRNRNHMGQQPLKINSNGFNFKNFNESLNVYDPYFELLPEKLKHYNPELRKYDFEVDLYGTKEINNIDKKYVLTRKPCKNFEHSFDRALKPQEMNIIMNLKGQYFFLAEKKHIQGNKKNFIEEMEDFFYFYKLVHFRLFFNTYFKYKIYQQWTKFKGKLFRKKSE